MLSEIVERFEPKIVKSGPVKKFGDLHDGSIQFPVITSKGIAEASYFYGDEKPKNIVVISSQTGCHYGCNFCELGKEKPSGDINLSADEMYEQVILMLQTALQAGFDIDTLDHKITVANTGEPLFNPHLVSGLEKLAELGTSFKVSTIFPPTRKARKNFEDLARFASESQMPVQLQISLISTSEDYRRNAAGVRLASFEEISGAVEYWRNLNPQGRKINLSMILSENTPCDVNDVYEIFPPKLFRFRLRPYVPTENGKRSLLVKADTAKLEELKESFRQKGYDVGDWASPTQVEQKHGLAANVTRGRYLKHFKFPQTRLEDLLEYRKTVRAELNLAFARKEAGMDPDSVDLHLQERVDVIYNQYAPRLCPADFYLFKTLERLEDFLRDVGVFDNDLIKRTIAHENSHSKKAEELGYEVRGFGCFLVLDKENKIRYVASTHIRNNGHMTGDEFKAIALAPDDPSLTDRY